ncbi:MAG: uracil-DNA glycosylase family protein [Isosphaeraceae bacterium]
MPHRTLAELVEAVKREAARSEFPVDREVYERLDRDPAEPILCAGSLQAAYCVVGRDLGKDEVGARQPLIGAGGRLVREGFYRATHGGQNPPRSDRTLESVLDRVLLTNTVPFKPPGNKAYATGVKERFRPFLAELLVALWQGDQVITLGNEAFWWFAPYAEDAQAFDAFWERDDRYEASLSVTVRSGGAADFATRRLTLLPLPHPSPLNQRWYARFPGLLDGRLASKH